jgi:hypothetical protein
LVPQAQQYDHGANLHVLGDPAAHAAEHGRIGGIAGGRQCAFEQGLGKDPQRAGWLR